MLYKLCDDKIDNKFGKIIKSAAKCEQSFIGDSFPVMLKIYWMETISLQINYRIKNVNIFVMCFLSEIVNVVYHIDFMCLFFFLVQ